MKIQLLAAALAIPCALSAQSALDAYQLSQNDLRGTARFMSMGGAFTALGGDLTTLGQNPAGIGVYRSSEVGATLDINFQSVKADGNTTNQTRAMCTNFGYIGAVNLQSNVVPYIQWGASYGRVASFDRRYKGSIGSLPGSVTNYVAGYTAKEQWSASELNGYASNYNPFQESYAPWMSVLMFNSYGINAPSDNSTAYDGLYNGTAGTATFDVDERGYVDEYNINFGGNIMNMVYWGMGFGIEDIDYTSSVYYEESFNNAKISAANAQGFTTGAAQLGMDSWKHISGTGWNFKIGAIIRPINELRIGLAVHTPTYYNLTQQGWAQNSFSYASGISGTYPNYSSYGTADDLFYWKTRTPWRLMAGVAGVIAQKGIVSVDYEYRPYNDMKVQDSNGNSYTDVEGDVKTYYQAQNILRLGAEYRVSSAVTLRAGYVYQSSPVTQATRNGENIVFTSGPDDTETQPSYSLDNTTNYVTAGIGFHTGPFYADAAYVWRHRSSSWQPYSPNEYCAAPSVSVSDNQSNIVISLGFKF